LDLYYPSRTYAKRLYILVAQVGLQLDKIDFPVV